MTDLSHLWDDEVADGLVKQYGGAPADWADLAALIVWRAHECAGEHPGTISMDKACEALGGLILHHFFWHIEEQGGFAAWQGDWSLLDLSQVKEEQDEP